MKIKNENQFLKGWLKVSDAAAYLGLCPRTVRTLLSQGLPHSRLPSGRILISIDKANEFLQKHEVMNNKIDDLVNKVINSL